MGGSGGSSGGLSLSLLEQLTFYGQYHHHPVNQVIHFVFVPAILWSLLVWLALAPLPTLPLPPLLPALLPQPPPLNAAAAVALSYALFYMLLEPFAGASWALCVGAPLWWAASAFAALQPRAALWAGAVHLLGWYAQIHPGHAVFERRKPALLDSLAQALTLAPLFVWFELLFACGYRKELRAQLNERVEAAIADWKRGQRQQQQQQQDTKGD